MAGEDMIMVRQRELKRLHVIQKVLEKVIKQVEAAEILWLSGTADSKDRQAESGVKGTEGSFTNREGRPSNRRIPDKIKDKIIRLYRAQYKDFGPTLASEKLQERDQLQVSDETLRLWLLESGDWKKRRKSRGHRRWRERKAPSWRDGADGWFSSRLV